MKYFNLVWAGIWRKKIRTIFTMLSVFVAFLLFGLLHGVNVGLESNSGGASASRLITASKFGVTEGLPISLVNQISGIDGIEYISHLTFFGGFFRDAKNPVASYAVDVSSYFSIYNELGVNPSAIEKMEKTRNGAIIGQLLADRFGWKVGDIVPLKTSIWNQMDGSNSYTFKIVGTFPSGVQPAFDQMLFLNYEFLNESRSFRKGQVHTIVLSIDDPNGHEKLSQEVDALFVNSPNETYTQTESALMSSMVKQMADIGFVVNSVVGAVLFTLLFLTGNTMMQSFRERIPELAILRTLGFSRLKVSLFVVCESVIICLFSALLGLLVASLVFSSLVAVLGPISMPVNVVLVGMLVAMILAIVSGLLPAFKSQRIDLVDALAGR